MSASYLSDLARDEAMALEAAAGLAATIGEQYVTDNGRWASLEAGGWRGWYAEIFGDEFVSVLAPHHVEAIHWHWDARMAQRRGEVVEEDAYFAIWSRGHMKSTVARRIAVADACLASSDGRGGYCLYLSGTKGKVEGHATSIETLITSPGIREWYPKLASVRRNVQGNSKGWTQNLFYTDAGHIFHFVSLDEGIRGANRDDVRPTLIVPDDIDEPEDSPAVSAKRYRTFTRSILPTRQRGTLVFFAQNLIAKHSVMNKIYSGKERALAKRRLTAPVPAVVGLETELKTVDGRLRDIIVGGEYTWGLYGKERCQEEIDTIGLPAFKAECQHDLTADDSNRVLPEYDERIHVISWSQFAAVFGARHIPAHWQVGLGHDIGYTEGHLSAASWIATSAANSKLPNKRFRYRGKTWLDKSPDEMAEDMIRLMRPDAESKRFHDERPMIKKWRMSHEKKGERKTYRDKYKLPFLACDSAKTAGIPQWRHYLRSDKSRPHPFHQDVKVGSKYLLGEPGWYDVVDDDQLESPRDDRGLKLHREQALSWLYAPEHLTDRGLAPEQPVKAFEDTCDSTRMVTADWGVAAAQKTEEERREDRLPERARINAIEELPPEEQGRAFEARDFWLARVRAAEKAKESEARRGGRFLNRYSFIKRRYR